VLVGRCGAPFTFATFHEDRVIAPGQIGWRRMRDVYRYDSITDVTKIYGVVADPVGGSLTAVTSMRSVAGVGSCVAPPPATDPESTTANCKLA
jgi:3-dehydroquinate dehydratase/shikimate dehydrogenase